MGRRKLGIKKLENNKARIYTYSKRKAGILKKAKDLSILCDVEIMLLMFSPSGKPSLCLGEQSLEQMIVKFSEFSPEARETSKLKTLETLKKAYKNLDHDVKIEDVIGSRKICSDQRKEILELTNRLHKLKAQLAKVNLELSYWTDPEKTQSIDHLQHMEDNLRAALNRIEIQKARVGNQLMPQGYSGQFQNSCPLHMVIMNDQQSPHMLWIHDCDGHLLMLSEDAYLAESSPGRTLHSYVNTQRPECCRQGLENGSNDLSENSYLQLQHGVHNPCLCCDMNRVGEYKRNPDGEWESHVDLLKFDQQPNTGYDTEIKTRASFVKFDEHIYAQTQNPLSSDSSSDSNMEP